MADTVAADIVMVARQAAAILSTPPEVDDERDPRLRQWEDLALGTAGALARCADYDVNVLRAALWPPVDTRTEPAWRVLLTLALLVAQHRAGHRAPRRSTVEGAPAASGALAVPR